MFTSKIRHFSDSASHAFVASLTIVSLLFLGFFMAEPAISHGQADTSNDFTISQTITGENSFIVQPTNVTMNGSIAGLTGGQATGSTQFVVQSNNGAGYYVMIDFFDNGTTEAMLGETTASESIRDYDGATASGMQPSYGFTGSTSSQFAYTVTASSSGDVDQSFKDNGSACDQGAGSGNGLCWMAPSTTPYRIIDTTSAAPTGATSSITFSVVVPSGADPTPVTDTYTATATLTLFTK